MARRSTSNPTLTPNRAQFGDVVILAGDRDETIVHPVRDVDEIEQTMLIRVRAAFHPDGPPTDQLVYRLPRRRINVGLVFQWGIIGSAIVYFAGSALVHHAR
jgi:hypothetical protein